MTITLSFHKIRSWRPTQKTILIYINMCYINILYMLFCSCYPHITMSMHFFLRQPLFLYFMWVTSWVEVSLFLRKFFFLHCFNNIVLLIIGLKIINLIKYVWILKLFTLSYLIELDIMQLAWKNSTRHF